MSEHAVMSTTQQRIAEQAVSRDARLAEIRARQAEIEAQLARPSELARELIELEQAERAAAYSAEVARQTIVEEYRNAKAAFEEARDGALDLAPKFIEAMEKAYVARGRLDAAQRRAKHEDFLPVRKLGLSGQRELMRRWMSVARKGWDF